MIRRLCSALAPSTYAYKLIELWHESFYWSVSPEKKIQDTLLVRITYYTCILIYYNLYRYSALFHRVFHLLLRAVR